MARPGGSTSRALYESLSTIGKTWPRDALRPEMSFGQSVVQAAEYALAEPSSTTPPPPSAQKAEGAGKQRAITTRSLEGREAKTAEDAIQALFAIKRGKASAEYPVPNAILHPASNPQYYARLADMLQKATEGNRVSLTLAQRVRLFFGKPI